MSVGSAAELEPGCACRPADSDLPVALLTATVDQPSLSPPLLALTVGYEARVWRADALARHLVEWTLDFAMRREERQHLTAGRAMEVARRAVRATFGNGNDRGVPGEILLHATCRQFFGSDTVISKVWFKTADNDTYKGFDAVHCVHTGDELELWLGEAKFYRNLNSAIRSAVGDLEDHLEHNYLRTEFALIAGKIEDDHPHAQELRTLMHPNTSLDTIFARIVVPVLIAYDSEATCSHDRLCAEYTAALEAEVRRAWMRFARGLDSDIPVCVRLFLVPMASKKALTDALAVELGPWR